MSSNWLESFFRNIFDDEWRGSYGERLTVRKLKWVQLFGRKGKVLRNVYLPKDNGETSEIDVLFITQKGIFVFESKNYSGWIFGDEKSRNWTAMLPNRQKNQFYNPIMQNKTHMKWLGNYVGEDIPLFSIIVFSERCELKKVTVNSEDIKVIKRDRTYATVREIWNKSPDALPEEKIDELYNKLNELTNVDAAVKEDHIANIEKKYKKSGKPDVLENPLESAKSENPAVSAKMEQGNVFDSGKEIVEDNGSDNKESQSQDWNATQNPVCPRCGNKLVLRTAKKGENAGKQFYGCSAFPKCRYIMNINEAGQS